MWARNSPEVGFGERETPKARELFSPFEVASGREALGFSRSPNPTSCLIELYPPAKRQVFPCNPGRFLLSVKVKGSKLRVGFNVTQDTTKGLTRLEDHLIIDLFWNRSESAIAETVLKYEKYCRSIAINILHNSEDADECVNDAYMNLWNAIPPQKPASLRAYLARITRNLSLNRYRHKNTLKRGSGEIELIFDELEDCISSRNGTDDMCEMKMLTEHINTFVKTLSQESQLIFIRRYVYSDAIRDISAKMSISESKVKTTLFRCREKLKKHLEREGVTI